MRTLLSLLALSMSFNGFSHSLMPDIDIGKYDASNISDKQTLTWLKDDHFVYRPITYPFQMSDYFSANAHWQPLEEALLHWSAAFGVDPRIILTTLAMSHNWSPASEVSVSSLSIYQQEVKSIANQLSQLFYHFHSQNVQGMSAASYAIASSLNDKDQVTKWQSRYVSWFGKPIKSPERAVTAIPDMQWPWRAGYNWIPNGPHSHTGSGYPLSSIDVAYDWPGWGGQTYSVTAAHEGQVSVFSRCQLRVTHPDGWATNYYHMDGITVSDGDWVNKDQRIGTYASQKNIALCQGGSSTGPHLHFSLLYNGRFQSLQDISFGPYKIDVGRYSYDSNCRYTWMLDTRSNSRKCFWNRVDNP
ncbi:M23 family metallopeptidase [Pseudoalteromonas rubra]|uniref:Peptidase M23 n=1 Tax=Pseudoalteromonas rubra TaxID=43658 RepID=A0A0F4QE39_9GAMM|nr:M23 family metallopeptidase [Pseudoalteromonas rubra]KJZ05936.1 peptidase M23 [Pseudoalteromonas rubra]